MRARDELNDQTREEASRAPQAGPGENGQIEDERCDCTGPVTINGGMCGSKFCGTREKRTQNRELNGLRNVGSVTIKFVQSR
jgi:hypothetical protein